MTRQVLDSVLRIQPRASDERYFEGESPIVLKRGWGVRHSLAYLEEEMNPITVLKLFGRQAVTEALTRLLKKTSGKAFDLLFAHLTEATEAAHNRDAHTLAAAITDALFEIK